MTDVLDEVDSTGSSSATTEAPPVEPQGSLQCAWCGFIASSERGLTVHVSRKHPEHYEKKAPSRKAPVTQKPVDVPHAPPPPDLQELKKVTTQNVMAVGQLLEGVLVAAHARALMNPDGRFPIKDTHLAYAIQLRAELLADVWVKHAAQNESLMALLNGFNKVFTGGDEGVLVGSLALSALATVGRPAPSALNGMFIPDVMNAAAQKDAELRAQLAAAARQQQEATNHA